MSASIDHPLLNDNRKYEYTNTNYYVRPEFPTICKWIPQGARIIDLGCGNGSLMKYLIDRKNVSIFGMDISASGISHCKNHGLKAMLGRIDRLETYEQFREDEFDFAICNATLQMTMFPEILIRQMRRVAKQQIISVPNFAHFFNRLELLALGRMPRFMLYGYEWYSTGHIHQLSIGNFRHFCRKLDLNIERQYFLGRPALLAHAIPTFFARTGIFLCSK